MCLLYKLILHSFINLKTILPSYLPAASLPILTYTHAYVSIIAVQSKNLNSAADWHNSEKEVKQDKKLRLSSSVFLDMTK